MTALWKIRDWTDEPGDGCPFPTDICGLDDRVIGIFYESPDNAALAVRAVNAHHDLTAAARAVVAARYAGGDDGWGLLKEAIGRLEDLVGRPE